ncbi:DEAD/DEAH box helicase [Corynebacterium sp. 13CS0277]|uniref:DEAD/DEAH box helicase n=1 Tax=Corynebacterium sp. 13CS0277 TaxID=2071994 RepID=UPI000D031764|nr:DEAD/DEAH box helicase [Corynebacterium sp. 13CS0277]PRQ12172.1 DEAD/DEAH box helicase [Corynebacterium sp. 13CS0277]
MSVDDRSFGGDVVEGLRAQFPRATLTAVRQLPPRQAEYADWPEWVPAWLRHAQEQLGVTRLYSHQAAAADLVWRGRDVAVATGTSSGKSLCYQLPIAAALAADELACALYLTPTKALGYDQLDTLTRLTALAEELAGVVPAAYDGDTPQQARRAIREQSRFLVTNPDMLHAGIMAQHERWGRLLRNLRVVVVDEAHIYRGVFGAHVSLVLRRLLRLCAHYGAHPVVVCASATSRNPAAHAARLTGRDVEVVDTDGAPQGARTIVLWEPDVLEEENAGDATPQLVAGTPVRRAASSEAARVMAHLIREGLRTLTFVRSRRGAETVALRAQEELALGGRVDFAQRVAAYRAGYTPEERRLLERQLDDGFLLGVAATNALELGIDVGGLDAVVTAGVPGSVASLWQQAGRAGRRGQGSVVVLVARDEPMDAFLVHHPQALLDTPLEEFVFDPGNPYVLRPHLLCAAAERPLSAHDLTIFGGAAAARVVDALVEEGLLRRRGPVVFLSPRVGDEVVDPRSYHAALSLRGEGAGQVAIVDAADGRIVGSVDAERAESQVHDGAVYVHQGVSFVVDSLDVEQGIALVHREDPWFSTRARESTDIALLSEPAGEDVVRLGAGVFVARADVEVTHQVTDYLVRNAGGETVDVVPLGYPPRPLVTRAVAFTIDPLVLQAAGVEPSRVPGALHAAEHAMIGMLPLLATCDRLDIGGVSTALHPETALPTVFVYDGHWGGAGFADQGFVRFAEWVDATRVQVGQCPCEAGCPSCIQSPKCGNGNEPLDKAGALAVLEVLDISARTAGLEGLPTRYVD